MSLFSPLQIVPVTEKKKTWKRVEWDETCMNCLKSLSLHWKLVKFSASQVDFNDLKKEFEGKKYEGNSKYIWNMKVIRNIYKIWR